MESSNTSSGSNISREGKNKCNEAGEAAVRNPDQSEGMMASVKGQIDSMTSGPLVTDTKNKATAVAGETINGVKETVLDGAVPAAAEALQGAQDRVLALAGRGNEAKSDSAEQETNSPSDDPKRIDEIDEEQVCNFLREKHMSTRPPPSTN